MKFRIIIVFIVIFIMQTFTKAKVSAQTVLKSQFESATFPGTDFDASPNVRNEITARRSIVLKNGFKYTSNPTTTFSAKIDEKIYKSIDFQAQSADPLSPEYPDKRQLNKSLTPGSIPGQINVENTGIAVYNMAIDLPEGRSGLKPNLSITYNSGGGNSILGHNFQLSGLSKISLTSNSAYFDNDFIQASQEGPFSLDGQRLLKGVGNLYNTEKENYLTITQDGSPTKDSYFQVVDNKTNQVFQYGYNSNENNSKGSINQGTFSWNINQIKDKFNNEINFSYKPPTSQINGTDKTTGDENVLEKITYGENEITFIYSLREDDFHSTIGTVSTGISTILDKIYIKKQGTLIAVYEFKYKKNSAGMTCLIEAIKKNVVQEQLNSTLFRWNEPNAIHFEQKNLSMSVPAFTPSTDFKGDFNKDGFTDLLIKNKDNANYKLYKFDKDGNVTEKDYTKPDGELLCSGDFDGDGKTEILGYYLGKACLWTINPNAFFKSKQIDSPIAIPFKVCADLNNNGIADFYFEDKNNHYTYMWEFVSGSSPTPLGLISEPITSIITGDFDNNGYTDFVMNGYIQGNANSNMNFGIVKPSNLDVRNGNSYRPWSDYGAFDINNDGKIEKLSNREIPYIDPITGLDMDLNRDGDSKDTFWCYNTGSGVMIYPWDSDYYLYESGQNYYYRAEEVSEYYINNPSTTYVVNPDGFEVGRISYNKSQQTDFNGDGQPEYLIKEGNKSILITTASKSNSTPTFSYIDTYGDFSSDGATVLKDLLTGDFNGDGATDFIDGNKIFYCPTPKKTSVAAIIDGNNNIIEITYDRRVDISETQPLYPLAQASGPFNVVSSVKKTVGGVESTTTYSYSDSRFHMGGKGFLGFSNFTEINEFSRINTIFELNTEYIIPTKTTVKVENRDGAKYDPLSTAITEISLVSKNTTKYKRYAVGTITTEKTDLVGNKTKQSQVFDTDNGYLTSESTSKYSIGQTTPLTTVATTYSGRDNNSYKLPETITRTTSRPNITNPTISTTETCTYTTKGLLLTSTINGLTKTYSYDPWGNMTEVESSGLLTNASTSTQTDSYEYDETLHLYPIKHTNATKTQSTSKKYDIWGNATEEVDLNGNTTYHTYDNWGKKLSTTTPDGITYTFQTNWADGTAPAGSYLFTATFKDGVLQSKDYFDQFGQNIRNVSVGYAGLQLFTDNSYDRRGNVTVRSEPYPSNGTASLTTTYVYDKYGRVSTEITPNNTKKEFDYTVPNVVTTTINNTDETVENYRKEYDASGFLVKSSDPGGEIQYFPEADNLIEQIKSPGDGTSKRISSFKYDANRRKTVITDPDAGETTQTYYVNGNLKTVKNATGFDTKYEYDLLNRVSKKTIIENAVPKEIYSYAYDTDNKSIGLLSGITCSDGRAETYEYDDKGLGRVTGKTRKNNLKTLTYKYEYDTKGRVSKLTYPSNYAIKYEYNSFDDLTKILNATDGTKIWELKSVNEIGQKKSVEYGNNVKTTNYDYDSEHRLSGISAPGVIDFDYIFNDRQQLHSRSEGYASGSQSAEIFTYDIQNRLITATFNGTENIKMTYNFEGSNNHISKKAGIGTAFTYNLCANCGSVTSVNSKLEKFTPDGYMPNNHDITYTRQQKLEKITNPVSGFIQPRVLSIEYGLDNERFSQSYTDETSTDQNKKITTTWFTDGYESVVQPDGKYRTLNYIFADKELVAINVQSTDGTPAGLHYVYTDYLGSLRCITNSTGVIEQKLGFDAWGNRRNPETGALLTAAPAGLLTPRGFTGHEHLDAFGLINMNGRVYDPAISMFLSPDPYIQAPTMTQNFNRYSYCLNNPLMYTDPSGEFIFSAFLGPLGVAMDNACWGGLIGGAGYAAQTLFSGGKFESKAFWHSVGVGAISGVVTGGIGDMFGPLGGGLDGIGNQIAHEAGRAFTHGVANGLIAANTGGNMMQSFASGTLGSLGGSAFQAFGGEFAKSAVGIVGFSAVSGGVGAKLTGGDFWEGAATGATVGALNHYGHLGVGKAVKKAVAAIKQMDRDLENGDGFGQGIGEANPRSREQVIAGTRNTISLVGGWQLNTAMALYDISQDNSAANYLALGGAFLPKYIRNEGINAILSVSDTYKVSEKGYKYVGGKIQPKRHK